MSTPPVRPFGLDERVDAILTGAQRDPDTLVTTLEELWHRLRWLEDAYDETQAQLAELMPPPSYHDFMESDEWRAIADAAIVRAGGTCQLCKSGYELQVHHNTYARFGGREIPSDLVVLCRGCHTIIHLTRNLADKSL